MAKRPIKEKGQAEEHAWYTATLTPQGTVNDRGVLVDAKGRLIGRPVKVERASSKAEVEAILKAKGFTWESITIVKGRDPGLTWTGGVDRYAVELQRMMGRLHLNAAAPHTPSPIWVHDPDGTARTMWAKFMDESSHGLSVSDFPRFVICDVDGYPTLPLPSEAVKDETRWDGITAVVREQLDYWKATLQERIERLGKVKPRNAEDTDQLKQDKAALKALEAFDGWNYQHYAEQLLPGQKPHASDLDNRRLYRLSNGQLIPVIDLGRDLLRVDFWKHLLTLWDGPMDKRADNVRAFLDHHHRKGGKPEQFRDLVKDTLPRLRKLTDRELLVEKLEGWLQVALAPRLSTKSTQPQTLPFERVAAAQYAQFLRDELPGFSICPFPLLFSIGTRETYPDVKPGIMATDSGARNVEDWSGIDKAVRDTVAKRVPNGELKDKLAGWTYASIVPEGIPNPFDIPNPRQYLLDGSMIPSDSFIIKGRLSKAANDAFAAFRSRLKRAWASPMNLKKAKVAEYLDHHFTNGSNPAAFVDFLEVAMTSKSTDGKTNWPNYVQPLQKVLAAWVEKAQQRLEPQPAAKAQPAKSKDKEWTTLKACALFHALLYEATKTEIVDLSTDAFANDVAIKAGHGGKDCGKRLRRYFHTYRTAKGRMAKDRLNSTVLKRYDEAIGKLGKYPEALALAKQERKEVYQREE